MRLGAAHLDVRDIVRLGFREGGGASAAGPTNLRRCPYLGRERISRVQVEFGHGASFSLGSAITILRKDATVPLRAEISREALAIEGAL